MHGNNTCIRGFQGKTDSWHLPYLLAALSRPPRVGAHTLPPLPLSLPLAAAPALALLPEPRLSGALRIVPMTLFGRRLQSVPGSQTHTQQNSWSPGPTGVFE